MPEAVTHEEWRGVPGWGNYEVSCHGAVRSLRRACGRTPKMNERVRPLRPVTSSNGRAMVMLCRRGEGGRSERRYLQVHRLVLLAFVGPPAAGQECRHFPDPDPRNNNLWNLAWGPRWRNELDKPLQGMKQKRLTREQILEARRLSGQGLTQAAIAGRLGVHPAAICRLLSGKHWRHVG